MKYSHLFVSSLLLCSFPSFMAYPQEISERIFPIPSINGHLSPFIQRLFMENHVLSYDAILELIEQIENDELDESCTPEDWNQICHFLAYLARQGTMPSATEEEKAELERDIEELLNSCKEVERSSYFLESKEYAVVPAVYSYEGDHAELCKSWIHKQWNHTKHFIKHHKVAVIVGSVLVVAAVVVVTTVVVASSTAAAATAAAAAKNSKSKESPKTAFGDESSCDASLSNQEETLEAVENQVSALKTIADKNDFLASNDPKSDLFDKDNARTVGSALTHETIDSVAFSAPSTPLSSEALNLTIATGHGVADLAFSTEQSVHHVNQEPSLDDLESRLQKNVVYCQGEQALKTGNYEQAIDHFSQAIAADPQNNEAYLQRAVAYMELEEYEHSLSDYSTYSAQETLPSKDTLSNTVDFGVGFAKGLPKGVMESGHQLAAFASELVSHPIDTGNNVCRAFTSLAKLALSQEWATLSQSLAPEVCQLINEWNLLSSQQQGERSGYIFAKYGGDILIPGAAAKVLSKGIEGAKEIALAAKNLETAEQTLALEALSQSAKNSLPFAKSPFANSISESENRAFRAETNRKRHAKFLQDYFEKPTKEIQKGIVSYEKQIAIHQEKISNPSKYIKNWHELDPRKQEALINKIWPAEIQLYTEQRDILQFILNQRE